MKEKSCKYAKAIRARHAMAATKDDMTSPRPMVVLLMREPAERSDRTVRPGGMDGTLYVGGAVRSGGVSVFSYVSPPPSTLCPLAYSYCVLLLLSLFCLLLIGLRFTALPLFFSCFFCPCFSWLGL